MGLAAARTTLVKFIAADGVAAAETFSIDTLSWPDAFGFYEKNAADLGDGKYQPSNAVIVALMGALQPDLPNPNMIPRNWHL